MPGAHAAATIALTIATFILFASGRVRIEVVCLMLISCLALGFYFFPLEGDNGLTGIEIAFGGFGHEALITICSLMILGRGLVSTGALEPATAVMARLWNRSKSLGLLCTLLVCGGVSMFINDTPVLILAMPILLNLAARSGYPASRTLMPVNFAILIGGMATTIGTSTNLLVVSLAEDLGVSPIGIFDFTGIALVAAAIALPYLWLIMPRLLPAISNGPLGSPRKFSAALHVNANSTVMDATLETLRSRLGPEIEIGTVRREGQRFRRNDPAIHLRAGDVVHIEGSVQDLRIASDRAKAPLAPPGAWVVDSQPDAEDDELIAEVVIGAESPLVGATARSAQISDRYGAVVIGLYRPDRALFHEALDTSGERLEVGDVLLVRGGRSRLQNLQTSEGAMILEGASEVPRAFLAPAALLIVASVITAAALRIVPISIASLTGTIAMIAIGCVKFDRLGRALSAEVIVLVAASIALGRALLETGAAGWMGGGLATLLGPFPPAVAVAAVMTFTALITNFSSNTAAAAVGTPIAVSVAGQLGIAAEPMVLAVLFGANLAFATPMAYQTNILIMSAGGYRFQDYVRAGVPLVILMIVTLSILLVGSYGL
ncbi:MAG TPA: SLC13 family permease [Hyphomonadaceae bacterium]|nr:SLC13 family permease [Hyphomonadaceae bacterium]HPI47787.1 SLC13 family permease [Hyphomonadaceae bacterium]